MELPVNLLEIEMSFFVYKILYMVLRGTPTLKAFLLLIVILDLKY